MQSRLVLIGLAVWTAATLALRLAGPNALQPGNWIRTLLLFALSFAATAWFVRRLCRRFLLRREDWPAGAISILLPTLLLDPFSSAFFPQVFPNLAPEAAGLFGGWMLICCAGALLGATISGGHDPTPQSAGR
ncbi:MAG TPA: DUF5367 family protein [Bryobacteraceae bacterium]|nr:DUF5367 family protein [Bryobacteraceae bacterium]